MFPVNLCNPPSSIAHVSHLASTIRRSGSAAPIAGDLNSHHELRDGCSPSTGAREDLAATPGGMDSELSDDPAQAARIGGRSVSFPNLLRNAYCVCPTGRPLVYMDSDHHLPSHTAGTEDGIPRQTGMLPRRKHAALALRAADWNACTSACAKRLWPL
ncbi:hypothetical protein TcBrA4_0065210 [Trypanosoma cruzi]|nr:hypothetical protein TcBrA4_0065210 [Trypanosoma cruzi]